ncbi:MAG: hypothetical protein J7496_08690 [Novosphingobium sp.]|nr:hypothetical protein [Novosphingobium sp.]
MSVAIAALKASADLLALLARKGLVSPEEVDAFAEGLMMPLCRPEGHPMHAFFATMREHAEHTLSGPLATAKADARAYWRGG